jgi:hypothetical protein
MDQAELVDLAVPYFDPTSSTSIFADTKESHFKTDIGIESETWNGNNALMPTRSRHPGTIPVSVVDSPLLRRIPRPAAMSGSEVS